ncbi:TPA: hypothetical protein HA242_00750 [Candidatus Woesearchaeota archaeon]|nr:hypothetical protein [Candidatus Woesearchaeota archaeon]HIH12227.1 hypothetical protein [Candidatus Woesearchaeota archaeon]
MKKIDASLIVLYTTIFLLVAVGVVVIQRGITGLVISESCCFPPNCAQDALCSTVEVPGRVQLSFRERFLPLLLGGTFIVVAVLFLLFLQKSKHPAGKERRDR